MKRVRGFTLVEVMIVVAILAVLASIALPSYFQYVLRSHRVDVRNTLQVIAQKIEQNYKITRSYNVLATDIGGSRNLSTNTLVTWGLNTSPNITSPIRYQIEVLSVSSDGYILRATAIGSQLKDKRCVEFYLNQSGAKSARANGDSTPPDSRSDVSRECWSK